MELPQDVLFISELYKKVGKELYVVGGAVRDHIRKLSPKDYDLATDATPDESIAILTPHFNVLEVGKAFGVVVAITEGYPDGIEIATFREDIGTGRRPDSVRFTTIESDVLRRDLTINALFYNIDKGEIVDLVGGIADLEARVIRTVGIPEDRFNDDPLRRFRAVRFAADLDGELAEDLYLSLKANSDLSGVSPERIRDEFLKLLARSKNLHKSLSLLKDLGMLHQLFPMLNIEIDKIGKFPLVTVALMLRNNIKEPPYDLRELQLQLNKSRWQLEEIATISHLIRLQGLTPTKAFQLKKGQKRCKVAQEEIVNLLTIVGKSTEMIQAFCKYEITTDPENLLTKGYKNAELGKELERIETDLFLTILKEELSGVQ